MGWFDWLRSEPTDKTLYCPHCLESSVFTKDITACPKCRAVLPPGFFAEAEAMPTLSIPLIGWTGCGKTVALEGMYHRLLDLRALWPGFTAEYMSDETYAWGRQVRQDLVRLMLPLSTRVEVQPPYLFALRNMRRWRGPKFHGRTLVIRDYPGEAFRDLTIPADQMRYIGKARVLMMMFCLSDLLDPALNRNQNVVDALLESYVYTLQKQFRLTPQQIKERRTGVVVVLSQADRLFNGMPDFPAYIREYVEGDPLVKAVADGRRRDDTDRERADADAELDGYVRAMKGASDAIGKYLLTKQPAAMAAMNATANNYGIRLRYCLVSALGHEPDRGYQWPAPYEGRRGKLKQEAVSYRVLDPLFTALELEREM